MVSGYEMAEMIYMTESLLAAAYQNIASRTRSEPETRHQVDVGQAPRSISVWVSSDMTISTWSIWSILKEALKRSLLFQEQRIIPKGRSEIERSGHSVIILNWMKSSELSMSRFLRENIHDKICYEPITISLSSFVTLWKRISTFFSPLDNDFSQLKTNDMRTTHFSLLPLIQYPRKCTENKCSTNQSIHGIQRRR